MLKNESISELTQLAYQFGPFFFALLFNLVISRWAYKVYNQASLNQNAPDTEKKTLKLVFVTAFGFGIVLVIASIWWWFGHQPSIYVFSGEIKQLSEYEKLASSDMYFKARGLASLGDSIPKLRSEEFVIIQYQPFTKEQNFDFMFSKGGGKPQRIEVNYDENNPSPKFVIEWNNEIGRNELKELRSSTSRTGMFSPFSSSAFAFQRTMQYKYITPKSSDVIKQAVADIQNKFSLPISQLQDEKTDIGVKISNLDQFRSLDSTSLRKIVDLKTDKESMILTLTDLTRHTDLELSYKAKELVKTANINTLIAKKLSSSTQNNVKDAQAILLRLDRQQAYKVLQSVDTLHASSRSKKLYRNVLAGKGLMALVPTGSEQGDRYYVKATWKPTEKEAIDCLTKLFNRELFNRPDMRQEEEYMKGRNERLVYWYSKEWAIYIAGEIRKCGGKADFVTPVSRAQLDLLD